MSRRSGRRVMRMYHHRELDRLGEPFKGKVRYRYFRRGLEGPIVDLERAFHEHSDSSGEGSDRVSNRTNRANPRGAG
jgi:hypothetical protein